MNTYTYDWQERIVHLVLASPLILFPAHWPWYMTIISWAFLLRAVTPVKWHDGAANVLPVLLVFLFLPVGIFMALFA